MHTSCPPAFLLAILSTTYISPTASLPGHPHSIRRDVNVVYVEDPEPTPKCADLANQTPSWTLTNGRWNTIGGAANTIWFDAHSAVTGVSTYCQGSDGRDYDSHLEYAWHFCSDNKSEIRFRQNETLLDIRSILACEGAEDEGDDLWARSVFAWVSGGRENELTSTTWFRSNITISASTSLPPASTATCAASLTLFGFRYECYIDGVNVPPVANNP